MCRAFFVWLQFHSIAIKVFPPWIRYTSVCSGINLRKPRKPMTGDWAQTVRVGSKCPFIVNKLRAANGLHDDMKNVRWLLRNVVSLNRLRNVFSTVSILTPASFLDFDWFRLNPFPDGLWRSWSYPASPVFGLGLIPRLLSFPPLFIIFSSNLIYLLSANIGWQRWITHGSKYIITLRGVLPAPSAC